MGIFGRGEVLVVVANLEDDADEVDERYAVPARDISRKQNMGRRERT